MTTKADSTPSPAGPSLGSVLQDGAALASVAAAMLHVAAAADHRDLPAQAWLFVLAAAFQLLWAMVAAWRLRPGVLLVGAVANTAFIATWVLSRTSGLAFLPGAGHEGAEPIGFPDTATVLLQLGIIAAAALYALVPAQARAARLPAGRLATGISFSAVGLLAVFGLVQAERGHGAASGSEIHGGPVGAAAPVPVAEAGGGHGHGEQSPP